MAQVYLSLQPAATDRGADEKERYIEPVGLVEGLRRTIARERANPLEQSMSLGILDDEPEEPAGAGQEDPG